MDNETLTKRQIKIALLESITTYGTSAVNRFNLIGRTAHEGDLYRKFGRELTDHEKYLASVSFDELVASGHLLPQVQLISGSDGQWAKITEKGRYALASGTFDELDSALASLDPELLIKRDGANEALLSYAPNAVQQAASSARELLNSSLRSVSPEKDIINAAWFEADPNCKNTNGVNFGHRVRFALENRGVFSEEEVDAAQATVKWAQVMSQKIVKATHSKTEPQREIVRDVVRQIESLLRTILLGAA